MHEFKLETIVFGFEFEFEVVTLLNFHPYPSIFVAFFLFYNLSFGIMAIGGAASGGFYLLMDPIFTGRVFLKEHCENASQVKAYE